MSDTGFYKDGLPKSVRGAPPELRPIIRRRQKSESAKRCRKRKERESARTSQHLSSLENRLTVIENVMKHSGHRPNATADTVPQVASQMEHAQRTRAASPSPQHIASDAELEKKHYDELTALFN